MILVRFALRNPYAVLAATLGLAFLGVTVLPRIPADILPDFEKPVVVSYFSYPGLPTDEMEKSVTSRVERVLTLAGKRERIESRTVPGASIIRVFFQPGADPSSAMNDVVNLEMNDIHHLPPGIEFPFTLRSEPANLPVILAAISGEGLSETDLYKIGYYAVRNKMGGLEGVQIPHPFGGRFKQMMVYVQPARLEAYRLSPMDVVDALADANLVLAGGTLKLGTFDYQVHPLNTLPTPEEIDAVPVAVRDGRTIYVGDVATTRDDAQIQTNIVRVDGNRSVYVPLLREPGRNTIEVVDRIVDGLAREVPRMKARGDIPEETQITLVSDQSSYIRTALRNLQIEVLLGGLLVVVVVGIFLRKLRPSIAVVLTLPLSILSGLLGFYFTGESLNVMTLGGIALAVGTVVDAGIVVVENIVRHRTMGKSALDAARDGAEEVAPPVLAGTVTTLAVFVPALFLTGMVRFLFVPLSLAAVLTIAASYVIAMTVGPAFCARFPSVGREEDAGFAGLGARDGWYGRSLRTAMGHRQRTVMIALAVTAGALLLAPFLGTELFPEVDDGTFEIRLKTTPGTRLEETERLVARVESAIQDVVGREAIESLIANIGLPVGKGAGFSTVLSPNSGPDTAFLVVNLSPDRSETTGHYVRTLRRRLAEEFPTDEFLFVTGGIINAALNEGVAAPIDVQLAAGNLEAARKAAERIEREIREIPGAVDVQIAQSLDYPQLDVEVDRTKAAIYGLTQRDVAENVLAALGSSTGLRPMIWIDPATGIDFFMGVQYRDNEASSLDELRNLPLTIDTPDGPSTLPLSSVARIRRTTIPGEIGRRDLTRVNDVLVNVAGRDPGGVAADVEKRIATLELPDGVTYQIRGPVQSMREGAQSLLFGLLTATVIVFLVLMAQFRSVVDPLLIMLAVPLALAGSVATLFVTGTYLSIQSIMGALMLIGIVVNNSILIVEFANRRLEHGDGAFEAVFDAARIRLRPILMTSLVLIASMLPFALGIGRGSEAMVPLARAMVGGMLASTALVLYLVPAVYPMVKGWSGSVA